ncbi:MAG: galactokinase [Kiritimatiellae bacterium]|nr:galactokinase [Kiritimatiellia bacterium]
MDEALRQRIEAVFGERFGRSPAAVAYAPGRIEVLGNHTDYNEGFVLSAAINYGTAFAVASAPARQCRVAAADLNEAAAFDLTTPTPSPTAPWANYVKGVVAKLAAHGRMATGFDAAFGGDLPLGAGLSSSAALEVSAALALAALYAIQVSTLDLVRLCQAAEHEYAGMKCGLLDQISSLYGREGALILSDFRSLNVENVSLGPDACFLVCNTKAKHSLVDSAYNERRARCEEAAAFFASVLDQPVRALRDVTSADWAAHAPGLDPVTARRALHVIGENERVSEGRKRLEAGELDAFGRLMYLSHASSQNNFENSCRELDFIVETARTLPGALGARLSGGGFGGSAAVLTRADQAEQVGAAIEQRYNREFGHPCDVLEIRAAAGARLIR